jgi:hypothetical protein
MRLDGDWGTVKCKILHMWAKVQGHKKWSLLCAF